ncbi:MAG: CoB--CoM heterodisulfide reductase iron-sulfur subunit B family protein [Chloroflexi bacterium]|nr:CoB--CoM heterodisulfide reductase iron-sulfur subunit B family protein [Chloroflexota bacterium]
MRYAYYPGCSLHASAKDYDLSARAVCAALGIELEEIPDWVCCGASSAHMTSELLGLALPVMNLVAARESGLDVVACCAACYSRLQAANKAMNEGPEHRRKLVDEVVGSIYRGEVRVLHLLEIIVHEYGLPALRERVKANLEGLNVASYYGCLLVRPPDVVHLDDSEDPTLMDELAVALGARAVNWPYKTECCGGSLSLTRTDVVLKLCHDILRMAVDEGADCLMVACPLCQANLDLRQAQVNREYSTDFHLPVLYFTQLIGLALGIDPAELGLDKLMVSPEKILRTNVLIQER